MENNGVGAGGRAVSSVQDVVQLSTKEEEGKYTNSYSSVFGLSQKPAECRFTWRNRLGYPA